MPITPEEFIQAYPTLFHVSLADDVEQISRHGLLSTSALLDLCEIEGKDRTQIESLRREEAVSITHPVHGRFLINDQAPMTDAALGRCLIGVSPREWYESLNRRVFFWPTQERLAKHLAARLGRGRRRLVLSFDTRTFVDVLGELIELSPINSGNTMRNPAPRGRDTFLSLHDYPFHERKKRVGLGNAVAEVTYPYAILAETLTRLCTDAHKVVPTGSR